MNRNSIISILFFVLAISSTAASVETYRGIILRSLTPPCSGGCTNLYLQTDFTSQIIYLTGNYLTGGYVGLHVQVFGLPTMCNGCASFYITQPIVVLSPASAEDAGGVYPSDFILKQNYPNPFNPSTEIEYSIPAEGIVTVSVYSEIGEKIETLASHLQSVGVHTVEWKADRFPTGVYFAVVSWDRQEGVRLRRTTPMLLIK